MPAAGPNRSPNWPTSASVSPPPPPLDVASTASPAPSPKAEGPMSPAPAHRPRSHDGHNRVVTPPPRRRHHHHRRRPPSPGPGLRALCRLAAAERATSAYLSRTKRRDHVLALIEFAAKALGGACAAAERHHAARRCVSLSYLVYTYRSMTRLSGFFDARLRPRLAQILAVPTGGGSSGGTGKAEADSAPPAADGARDGAGLHGGAAGRAITGQAAAGPAVTERWRKMAEVLGAQPAGCQPWMSPVPPATPIRPAANGAIPAAGEALADSLPSPATSRDAYGCSPGLTSVGSSTPSPLHLPSAGRGERPGAAPMGAATGAATAARPGAAPSAPAAQRPPHPPTTTALAGPPLSPPLRLLAAVRLLLDLTFYPCDHVAIFARGGAVGTRALAARMGGCAAVVLFWILSMALLSVAHQLAVTVRGAPLPPPPPPPAAVEDSRHGGDESSGASSFSTDGAALPRGVIDPDPGSSNSDSSSADSSADGSARSSAVVAAERARRALVWSLSVAVLKLGLYVVFVSTVVPSGGAKLLGQRARVAPAPGLAAAAKALLGALRASATLSAAPAAGPASGSVARAAGSFGWAAALTLVLRPTDTVLRALSPPSLAPGVAVQGLLGLAATSLEFV